MALLVAGIAFGAGNPATFTLAVYSTIDNGYYSSFVAGPADVAVKGHSTCHTFSVTGFAD